MSRFDIMLPYYGDVGHMKAAVRSVISQSFQDWNLTVLDNCYPDPEPSRWFDSISDPRVTYIKNAANIGLNANFRKALSMVQAEYFVVMGADDIMLPNYLELADRALSNFPAADVVQLGVKIIDQRGEEYFPLADRVKRMYAPKSPSVTQLQGEQMAKSLVRADWAYFPSLIWKTQTAKRYGFDPNYDVVMDLGLLLDIAAGGGTMIYDPTPAFLYRRHAASDSSVKARDGRRFDEERRFFGFQAKRFGELGWASTSRSARLHLSSRLNALSLVPRCLNRAALHHLRPIIRHIIS